MAVNDLRCVLTGRIEKHMPCIVLIVRAVNVAIVHRQLEVCRDLAAPLLGLRCLLRCRDRLVDCRQSLLIVLRDQQRNGILLIAAVNGTRLPDVGEADAAGYDHFGRGCCVIRCH